MTAPVPLSINANSSAIILTLSPSGVVVSLPIKFLYLVSLGLTKIATQAGKSSGRVVAIIKSQIGYRKEYRKIVCLQLRQATPVWQEEHQREGLFLVNNLFI